jgi:hypothetical protein
VKRKTEARISRRTGKLLSFQAPQEFVVFMRFPEMDAGGNEPFGTARRPRSCLRIPLEERCLPGKV